MNSTDHPAPLPRLSSFDGNDRLSDLLSATAARVTPEDLVEAIAPMPPDVRARIFSHAGLRRQKTITPSVARSLIAVLRGSDARRKDSLIGLLTGTATIGFANVDRLREKQCLRILTGESTGEGPVGAPILAFSLRATADLPETLSDLALTYMVAHDVPLAAVALALQIGLRGGDEYTNLWSRLRETVPALPAHPPSADLIKDAVDAGEPGTATTECMPGDLIEDDGATAEPREALNRLRRLFSGAATAARQVHASLAAGRRPEEADIEAVELAIDEYDRLHDLLTSDHGCPPESLDDLAGLVDAWEQAGSSAARVAALTRLQGPALLADLLKEVRAAAGREFTPGLDALARLVELAKDEDQILLSGAVEDEARAGLPPEWLPVILAAVRGALRVDDEPEAIPDDIGPDDAPEPAPEVEHLVDEEAPLLEPGAGAEPMPSAEVSSWDLGFLDDILLDRFETPAPKPPPSASAQTAPPPIASPPAGPVVPEAGSAVQDVACEGDEAQSTGEESSPVKTGWGFASEEAAALQWGRLGLAAWLRISAGRNEAEVAARRCAALAAHVGSFAGRASFAFDDNAAKVGVSGLADDPAGRLLAWAAAIRAGLVSPTPESERLVRELSAALPSPCPALQAYGEAFHHAAITGTYLVPEHAGRMQDLAAAEKAHAEAVAVCTRILDEAPHRTIKFALATEVWKTLMQPDGLIGELVAMAAADRQDQIESVSGTLKKLRSNGEIGRHIDTEAKRAVSKNNKIISRARERLVEMVDEALDAVAGWVNSVRLLKTRIGAGGGERLSRGLTELRQAVGTRRDDVKDELLRLGAGDPLLEAAADASLRLIDRTLELLDGQQLDDTEPALPTILHGDLLFVPGLRIDVGTLEPGRTPEPAELVPVAVAHELDWAGAFTARAVLGDHEGTKSVIALAPRELSASLASRRAELVAQARAERDERLEDLRERLAQWRRDGVLPENEANTAALRVQELARPEREDFDVIRDEIGLLEKDTEAIRRTQIQTAADHLTAKLASGDNLDLLAARERIEQEIGKGDLTTAREYLAQAEAGRRLPADQNVTDHFERFFPAFPAAFENMSVQSSGGRARKRETDEWIGRLMEAVRDGHDVRDPDLSQVVTAARLDLGALPAGRREESKEGLRLWKHLSQSAMHHGNIRTAIDAVLLTLGLKGEHQQDRPLDQHRLWVSLTGVRHGDALLPEFGSRMSPAGGTLRVLLVWRRPTPQQLVDWLREEPEDRTVLVLYFGVLSPAQREQLAATTRRRPRPVVGVVDDAAFAYLAALPEGSWTSTVSLIAPFTSANPFAPAADVPTEMFYGRSAQLEQVTNASGASIVFGGRQLGKSALLRKVERNLRRSDPGRVVILESIQEIGTGMPAAALWPRLAGRLMAAGVLPESPGRGHDREETCAAVLRWADEDTERQLLILLDEADAFLNQDSAEGTFPNVTALRDLMGHSGNRIKVVFAGLHQTARFRSLSNQPFTSTPIPIGPLDPQDAFDLLTRPLRALGYVFPPPLAARVIAEANNAPALIQLFAEALLRRLRLNPVDGGGLPHEITREEVAAVWREKSLATGFRDRFEWTLNLDKRYKVIAYTVAFHALTDGMDTTVAIGDLREECRVTWPAGFEDCSTDTFLSLVEECDNLGVLTVDNDRCRLRTPHVLTLLGGAEEVYGVLDKAAEFELPDSFDAHSYRSPYLAGPDRSPLTSAHVSRLLGPGNHVHLVTGSAALRLDRVPAALEQESKRQHTALVWREGHHGTLEGLVRRAGETSRQVSIVLTLGRSLDRAREDIRAAAEAVSRKGRGGMSIVLVAPPELSPLWLMGTSGVLRPVELRRYDAAGIRQWMNDADLGFQDEAGQAALLSLTGGWPTLVGRLIDGKTGTRDEAMVSCRDWLRANPAEFVRSTGVQADPALAAAWGQLAEIGAEKPQQLAEYLEWSGEEPDSPLHAARLPRHGYTSTADLVEVLRMLGALVPRPDGTFAPEPVLAETTARIGAE